MKKFLMLVLTIALTLSLAGCLKAREDKKEIEVVVLDELPTEKITITFWHVYGQGKSALLDEMIADFELLYPNIEVDSVPQGGYSDLLGKTKAWVSCGSIGFKGSKRSSRFAGQAAVEFLGSKIKRIKDKISIDNSNQKKTFASYNLVKTMRGSILVLGPLLAKFKKAKVSSPGGCTIGVRPIDIHLKALSKLGVNYKIDQGYVIASAPKGLIGAKIRFPKISVGAIIQDWTPLSIDIKTHNKATSVLPLPTSPCKSRFIGYDSPKSFRIPSHDCC